MKSSGKACPSFSVLPATSRRCCLQLSPAGARRKNDSFYKEIRDNSRRFACCPSEQRRRGADLRRQAPFLPLPHARRHHKTARLFNVTSGEGQSRPRAAPVKHKDLARAFIFYHYHIYDFRFRYFQVRTSPFILKSPRENRGDLSLIICLSCS